jgi:hypothetical protein
MGIRDMSSPLRESTSRLVVRVESPCESCKPRLVVSLSSNVKLELCQPGAGDSPHRDYLESNGEGIQHVLSTVENLQKEIDRLTGLGCSVLLRARFGEEEGSGGLAYVDLAASRLIIELAELPKKGTSEGRPEK